MFRSIACLGAERNFDKCQLGALCPYHYIFETPPPANSVVLDKVPTAPQPFILEPPLEEKRTYEPGEELIFHLVLIGKAFDYLPYFIYAFDELGRRGLGRGKGSYLLASVAWLNVKGTPTPVYDGEGKRLASVCRALTIADFLLPALPLQLTINFLTPTRLRYENHLAATCEFHVFFRNLARRLALLCYFHCDGDFPSERREFVESARAIETIASDLRWLEWARYSNRQQRHVHMGGLVGQVTYRGDFTEFFPTCS